MSLNDQDARALTYLARRLREDTYGANTWDEPGVFAVVSELVGQNLAVSIERVIRHATDVDAKTPGAIRRPFVPEHQQPPRPRNVAPVGSRCTVCGHIESECRRLWGREHEFTRPIPRDVDLAPVVAELKGHLTTTRPAAMAAGESETSDE